MADTDAASSGPLVSGAEIARLTGVTRAAVSNWRRRYEDFPQPQGGGAGSPLFALAEVQAWLERQHKGQEISSEVKLWQALRAAYGEEMVGALTDVARQLAGSEPTPTFPADARRLVDELTAVDSPAVVITSLVQRLADSARRSGSDQLTSERIVQAVRHFAGTVPADATVFDPACGIGSLLLGVGPVDGPHRIGQDLDPRSASLAQLRAELTDRTDVSAVPGDSLLADRWPGLQAEVVVCDPPVGVTEWGRDSTLLDSRWELGTPPRAEGELAWLQHAYAHTAPGGQVLMVMPASVAYRKGGRRIRAELVRRGLLVQLVALPAGVASSHALPVHLWQLRRPLTPQDAVSTVRLVDLSANAPDGPLDPAPGQVAEVPLIDLLDDTVDLTPGRHTPALYRDYSTEYAVLRERLEEQLGQLSALLPELPAGPGTGSLEGPTVSVAELARAGLVEYGESEPVSVSDQLDTDYLRGFLRSTANTRRSTSASGTYRADGRGARIPQLDIEEQRRYGQAFRALQEFDERVTAVVRLSREAAELARDGLGNGALSPRTPPPNTAQPPCTPPSS
ncbi:N-6 DNA methylase [Streptomyces albipurpureus]|uniref:SAM-dependent methyltransferase n=1 Tax=Streptomyces albipurpureus TaxID=2897419 RepID=A0ABT0UFW7_9ACTN|nr:N-6 DNA methylase [Streptomyces sp. CWNU-1]MCM2387303.1 SAM-dependent methyltransferase [Streptomyces sp. CWNU-1]